VIVISGTVTALIIRIINALGVNISLMTGVVAVVLVMAFFLVSGGQVASARCPCCLRLGRANHYGHCHCPACGAVFWLTAAGHPVRSLFVWQMMVGPLAAWVFGLGFFAFICFQRKEVQYALLPALAVLGIAAAFKLYRFISTKELVTKEHPV
jgi:hypothetical protein